MIIIGTKVRVKSNATMYPLQYGAPPSTYCGKVGYVCGIGDDGYEVRVHFIGRSSSVQFYLKELEIISYDF